MRKEPVRLYKDIDMKFTKNFISKDIGKKYDAHAVRQAMKNIIYTNLNERPFDPAWGSQIRQLMFEPIDDTTGNALEKLVKQAIVNHEPRVNVDRVHVIANYDSNEYKVYVYYYILGITDLQEMNLVLSRLR